MSTVARERPRYFFASGCQFISSVIHRAIRPHLDVGRFQIAMNDALCVRRFERLRDVLRDGQRLVEWDRSPSAFAERREDLVRAEAITGSQRRGHARAV